MGDDLKKASGLCPACGSPGDFPCPPSPSEAAKMTQLELLRTLDNLAHGFQDLARAMFPELCSIPPYKAHPVLLSNVMIRLASLTKDGWLAEPGRDPKAIDSPRQKRL